MRPTMADVAQKAGVSISTVSLVLNDKPGISSELRALVAKTVEEVGYRLPARSAVRLSSESKSITVVHYANPQSDTQAQISGVFMDFVASIRDYYQEKNVNWTLIANYRDGDHNNLGYHLLEADQPLPDGLILMGIANRNSSLLRRVLKEARPVVVLSRDWPELPISTVSQDHARHTSIALEYLVSLGHRKIAFVARNVDQEFDWYETRFRCYRDKMKSLKQWDESFVSVADNMDKATQAVLARHPETTAFFAVHDENAVTAMVTLSQMGYRIPQEMSVIGLDHSALSPKGLPALTTVGFAHDQVGRRAAELLLEQIGNPDFAYGKLFVRSQLIERSSCSSPRTESRSK